jgi:pSer/pThr/pTyr-binding forkhead associated (FHA) protein
VQLPDQTAVSSSHLEVTVDGWSAFARDLGSRNGTLVEVPGLRPIQLAPNDAPTPILPGTMITLGGTVVVTFEVA